jgi:hypothetical protein
MHRILLVGACFLATAMPAVSQTLRISLRQDLDALDPTLTTSYVARIVLAGLCDKLFDIDGKLNMGNPTTPWMNSMQSARCFRWPNRKSLPNFWHR